MSYPPGEGQGPESKGRESQGPESQDRGPDQEPTLPPSGPQYAQPPPAAYPPYGQQPGYPPSYGRPSDTNIFAILSLVFAFVFAPAGIVLGHVAKRQIRETGQEGGQLATWGLALSYVITALYVLACCVGVALIAVGVAQNGSSGY